MFKLEKKNLICIELNENERTEYGDIGKFHSKETLTNMTDTNNSHDISNCANSMSDKNTKYNYIDNFLFKDNNFLNKRKKASSK